MVLRQTSTLSDVLLTVYTIQIWTPRDSLSKKRILFLKSCLVEDRRMFLFIVEHVISADGEVLIAAKHRFTMHNRGEKRPKGREKFMFKFFLSS